MAAIVEHGTLQCENCTATFFFKVHITLQGFNYSYFLEQCWGLFYLMPRDIGCLFAL
jgi:hypothetical protein